MATSARRTRLCLQPGLIEEEPLAELPLAERQWVAGRDVPRIGQAERHLDLDDRGGAAGHGAGGQRRQTDEGGRLRRTGQGRRVPELRQLGPFLRRRLGVDEIDEHVRLGRVENVDPLNVGIERLGAGGLGRVRRRLRFGAAARLRDEGRSVRLSGSRRDAVRRSAGAANRRRRIGNPPSQAACGSAPLSRKRPSLISSCWRRVARWPGRRASWRRR